MQQFQSVGYWVAAALFFVAQNADADVIVVGGNWVAATGGIAWITQSTSSATCPAGYALTGCFDATTSNCGYTASASNTTCAIRQKLCSAPDGSSNWTDDTQAIAICAKVCQ